MCPMEQAENFDDLRPPNFEVRERTKDFREPSSDLVIELY